MIEDHILDALSFRGGISGASGVLLNCNEIKGSAIDKKYKSSRVVTRATHELGWFDDRVEIFESSGITEAEVVIDKKLLKHKKIYYRSTLKKNLHQIELPYMWSV